MNDPLVLVSDADAATRTRPTPAVIKTLATHTGMTNEWLEGQALLSIRQLWMKA